MNAPFGSVPPEPESEPKRETQVIAIYGKGGIGKSFTLANLSYMMAQQGKRVLHESILRKVERAARGFGSCSRSGRCASPEAGRPRGPSPSHLKSGNPTPADAELPEL